MSPAPLPTLFSGTVVRSMDYPLGDLILLASGNTCSRNSALLLWANHCILVHINRCVYGPLSRDYQSGRNWEECSSDGKTRAMQKVTPDCCFAGSTTTRITGVKLVANPAVWVTVMGQNPGCDQADMLRMSPSSSNSQCRTMGNFVLPNS